MLGKTRFHSSVFHFTKVALYYLPSDCMEKGLSSSRSRHVTFSTVVCDLFSRRYRFCCTGASLRCLNANWFREDKTLDFLPSLVISLFFITCQVLRVDQSKKIDGFVIFGASYVKYPHTYSLVTYNFKQENEPPHTSFPKSPKHVAMSAARLSLDMDSRGHPFESRQVGLSCAMSTAAPKEHRKLENIFNLVQYFFSTRSRSLW